MTKLRVLQYSAKICGAARGAYCKSGKSTAGVKRYRARLLRHTHIPTPVADNLIEGIMSEKLCKVDGLIHKQIKVEYAIFNECKNIIKFRNILKF